MHLSDSARATPSTLEPYSLPILSRCLIRLLPILGDGPYSKEIEVPPFWYWTFSDRSNNLISLINTIHFLFFKSLTSKKPYYLLSRYNQCYLAADFVYYTYEKIFGYIDDSLINTILDNDRKIDQEDENSCYIQDEYIDTIIYDSVLVETHRNEKNEHRNWAYVLSNFCYTIAWISFKVFNDEELSNELNKIRNFPSNKHWRHAYKSIFDYEIDQINNGISLSDFIQQPLWIDQPPSSWLRAWERLKEQILSVNSKTEPLLLWIEQRFTGDKLHVPLLEKLCEIPNEIAELDRTTVNKYLLNSHLAFRPINKVRAIFMGHGASGKTSLIKAIKGEKIELGKEETTPGIKISSWKVPNSEIDAILWDFGGQIIAHSTHQFFLRERCLYILVIDSRSEITATIQAEYWLNYIKAFGGNAKVIIVGNKIDISVLNIDLEHLNRRFPNIIGYFPISCLNYKTSYKYEFEIFIKSFTDNLKLVGTHQVLLTNEHFGILNEILTLTHKQSFLTHDQFTKICDKHNIDTNIDSNERLLVDILDKLGVIIHFKEMIFFDAYLINPRWLTYGCYKLIFSDTIKANKGKLSELEIFNTLNTDKVLDENGLSLSYPKSRCKFIIDAMESFKVCYKIENPKKSYIFPAQLPSNTPTQLPSYNNYRIKFKFTFENILPPHIVGNFIATHHSDILNGLVWQNGVHLKNEHYKSVATFVTDHYYKTIFLFANGEDADEYFHSLRISLLATVKGLLNLKYKEYFGLDISARIHKPEDSDTNEIDWANYTQIKGSIEDGVPRFTSELGFQYDLSLLLKNFNKKKETKMSNNAKIKPTTNINYNIGTIVGNNVFANDITGSSININSAALSKDATRLKNRLLSIQKALQDNRNSQADYESIMNELREVTLAVQSIEQNNHQQFEESSSKIMSFVVALKTGTAKCFKYLKTLKDADELIPWIASKAHLIADTAEKITNTISS